MEVTKHTVQSEGENVSVYLEGLQKKDGYGTNLEFTGQSNWFGSMNISNMMADNSHQLFASIDADSERKEAGLNYSMLELGSGLGRAGLMALKLIDLESKRNLTVHLKPGDTQNCVIGEAKGAILNDLPTWNCVLSDGEEEVTELLTNNYTRNFPASNAAESTSGDSERTPCVCQQLWWGENADLQALRQKHPRGFDLIIGADLIYGRDETVAVEAENEVEERGGCTLDADDNKVEDGFCRDKLKSLLYTVSALLSHRGSSNSTSSCSDRSTSIVPNTGDICSTSSVLTSAAHVNGDQYSPESIPVGDFDVKIRPAFYLAITRRELLPMDELRAVALSVGLQVSLLEDYTFDIFDQNVDSESMFWRDTILLFTRV